MILIGIALIYILFAKRLTPIIAPQKQAIASENSSIIKWDLGNGQSSELISNARLASLQRHNQSPSPGILEDDDLVIVWAEEFMDDELLYDAVKENIEYSVHYLYILDAIHFGKFNALRGRLEQDIPSEMMREAVDVIFIRSELALNNNVMMRAETGHQWLYSSMIHHKSPIAWFKQDSYRARLFRNRVKSILANLAFAQHRATMSGADPRKLDLISSAIFSPIQYNDYSILGKKIYESKRTPDLYPFKLKEELPLSELPEDVTAYSKDLAVEKEQHDKQISADEKEDLLNQRLAAEEAAQQRKKIIVTGASKATHRPGSQIN